RGRGGAETPPRRGGTPRPPAKVAAVQCKHARHREGDHRRGTQRPSKGEVTMGEEVEREAVPVGDARHAPRDLVAEPQVEGAERADRQHRDGGRGARAGKRPVCGLLLPAGDRWLSHGWTFSAKRTWRAAGRPVVGR